MCIEHSWYPETHPQIYTYIDPDIFEDGRILYKQLSYLHDEIIKINGTVFFNLFHTRYTVQIPVLPSNLKIISNSDPG